MEVLDPEHSGINLFDENWKIYSRNSGHTGHFIGNNAEVTDSMITDGCVVKGTVKHSILFGGVIVEEGAVVEDAVVMGDTVIKRGAKVTHCISSVVIAQSADTSTLSDILLNCSQTNSGKSLFICGSIRRVMPETDLGVVETFSLIRLMPSVTSGVPRRLSDNRLTLI